ncbi:LysR family transcriptional regulator [Tsukamurella sp. 8F]|uniref:LysR family transcriptional regulator n=1 Tax=unclassified Tsukamurella TaxID=2633480 RepID=UPI0023B8B7DE|nr:MULTISPECIES: LysR family transcriptional regulator [unclassified Tsukamurella]MDF0532094.1 LysR family transcriptional regulator [Tsukamurella sp. 8J]MDF0589228.1 LysR family transcriptional regulator [Tsukamurella sp. 8F]
MELQVRHLTAFVELCEARTYTAAARHLHVTQPSLSRTIQDLERVLATDLVVRGSRPLELTADGHEFEERARRILADLAALEADMRGRTEVRLGFAWLLPPDWFARVRAEFESLGGQVRLHRTDDPAGDLTHDRIDVALTRAADRTDGITWRAIGTEKRVLAVSARSPLATMPGVRWPDLAAHPLVVNTRTGTTRPDNWPDSDPDREIVTCINFDEWLELVGADRGIGAVPAIAVERAPHPDVVYRELPDIPDSRVYLGWRRAPSRTTRRFIDAALAQA